uniref:Mediator of RNA polymerase II transcription subunit 22 n=1 Tax=Arcella intermedia TaxID=1963864 RepID=A0A6B2LS74_9EUKA
MKINNHIDSLVTNYKGLLGSASINDKTENIRENFEIDVYTSNMVKSGEALLKIIAEIKHSMMLNDFDSIVGENNQMEESYKKIVSEVDSNVESLKQTLIQALAELESAYYTSKYIKPPTDL